MRVLDAEALEQIFADIIAVAVDVGEGEGGPRGMRPCIVNGKEALFHRWSEKADIYAPSPVVGGHGGGAVKWTVAIIEYEDGQVAEVMPCDIRFLDRNERKYTEREDTKQ